MKRLALVLSVFLVFPSLPAAAQVVHAATARNLQLSVGGEFSLYQPDYLGGFTRQSTGLGLQYGLDGAAVFADLGLSRWVGFEAEARWLRFNRNLAVVSQPKLEQVRAVSEDNYLIGPRVRLVRWHGFTPYAKGLVGLGLSQLNPAMTTTTTYPDGFSGSTHALAVAVGGGVDYRLGKHWSARLADFEWQSWWMKLNIPGKQYSLTPMPYGVSAGVSYRVF